MDRTALLTAQCQGTTLKPQVHFCQINRYTCCLERPSAAQGLRQHSRSMNETACDTKVCGAFDSHCVLRHFGAWFTGAEANCPPYLHRRCPALNMWFYMLKREVGIASASCSRQKNGEYVTREAFMTLLKDAHDSARCMVLDGCAENGWRCAELPWEVGAEFYVNGVLHYMRPLQAHRLQ
jgi:hypothetical protein